MIDTHAHLNIPLFLNQIEEIVDDCQQVGINGVIMASSNLEEVKVGLQLADQYPNFLYPTAGIHPLKTDPENQTFFSQQLNELDKLIRNNPQIIAVGECGLDDSQPPPGEEKRNLAVQKDLFIGQLEIAMEHDLPVIIHARGLVDEVIEILSGFVNGQRLNVNGCFHCYAGGKSRIKKILDLSGEWYFGIDGNITYDQGLQNVVAEIPRDRLLLETDSPYLAPEPHRGQTNTPANLPLIAQQIAEIWEMEVEEVIDITTVNTKKLFPTIK